MPSKPHLLQTDFEDTFAKRSSTAHTLRVHRHGLAVQALNSLSHPRARFYRLRRALVCKLASYVALPRSRRGLPPHAPTSSQYSKAVTKHTCMRGLFLLRAHTATRARRLTSVHALRESLRTRALGARARCAPCAPNIQRSESSSSARAQRRSPSRMHPRSNTERSRSVRLQRKCLVSRAGTTSLLHSPRWILGRWARAALLTQSALLGSPCRRRARLWSSESHWRRRG